MAYITVRHLTREDFRDMGCIFDDDKRLAYAREVLKNNNYERVADMNLGGSSSTILEDAYRLTNSIDTAWYENVDLLVAEGFQDGCRSTSVGDIVQLAGESYMVAGCGFRHIDMEV